MSELERGQSRQQVAAEEVDELDLHLTRRALRREYGYDIPPKEFERLLRSKVDTKGSREGAKHKLMVDGQVKYPINDCSDVQDAWGLRGSGKGVSQSRIESYIKGAASDLGCPTPGAKVERKVEAPQSVAQMFVKRDAKE